MENIVKNKKLVHAYLFLSPDELNNFYHALTFASEILCEKNEICGECGDCKKIFAKTNPDLLIFPSGKNIVVDDAETIVEKSYETPMNGRVKVFILKNIDTATTQAQNKILKTLEEPESHSIFLLTATNENKVLQTIISRTQKEYLCPMMQDELEKFILNPPKLFREYFDFNKKFLANEIETAVKYGEGWLGKTIEALSSNTLLDKLKLADEIVSNFSSSKDFSKYSAKVVVYRDELRSFLEILETVLRQKLIVSPLDKSLAYGEIIEHINNAYLEIERNVSINLIIDNLLMKILETKYNNNLI